MVAWTEYGRRKPFWTAWAIAAVPPGLLGDRRVLLGSLGDRRVRSSPRYLTGKRKQPMVAYHSYFCIGNTYEGCTLLPRVSHACHIITWVFLGITNVLCYFDLKT